MSMAGAYRVVVLMTVVLLSLSATGTCSAQLGGTGDAAEGSGFTVIPRWNAIPQGKATDIKTQQGCSDHCANTLGCLQCVALLRP